VVVVSQGVEVGGGGGVSVSQGVDVGGGVSVSHGVVSAVV
jgi:hypothetical protein